LFFLLHTKPLGLHSPPTQKGLVF